jgi:hypothetical protein
MCHLYIHAFQYMRRCAQWKLFHWPHFYFLTFSIGIRHGSHYNICIRSFYLCVCVCVCIIGSTWLFSSDLLIGLLLWNELLSVCVLKYILLAFLEMHIISKIASWRMWPLVHPNETQQCRRHSAFTTFTKNSLSYNLCVPPTSGMCECLLTLPTMT